MKFINREWYFINLQQNNKIALGSDCRDEPIVNDDGYFVNFVANNTTSLYKIKEKITGQIGNDGTKSLEIIVPLNYLSSFWRTLEMPSINCEINFILNWSANCVIVFTFVAN